MVFPIAGGNESKGYDVDNSLRFNDDDGPELKRTPSSAGDRKTFTTSFWVKRGNLGTAQRLWSAGTSIGTNNDNVSSLLFESNNTLKFFGEISGSVSFTLQTSQVFRDVSAWYHIVLAVDTTQSTSSNRVKIYVNGNQVTDFGTETYMSQNVNTFYNADNLNMLSYGGSGGKIDGYIAEFVNIDGTALTQTSFGEFDDNGVWIPIDVSGLDFSGTNSCHLEFKQTGTSQNSSGIGADTSGNDNHFAVTNLAANDVTTDTCTNNFATLNANDNTGTLSEGNLKDAISTSNARSVTSTIGVSSGKWYCEVVPTAMSGGGSGNNLLLGVVDDTFSAKNSSSTYPFNHTTSVGYFAENGQKKINGSFTSYGATFAVNDIIGVAFNLDDDEITFYKNGTTQGTISHTFPSSQYRFYLSHGSSAGSTTAIINFGQEGSFAGTKTAQGNSDGKYGNFYYAPPSGYYALCTKRLAEFG
jgi:hypothetical protein